MENFKSGVDALFIMTGAIMVLAMHAGFAFLELGTVRKKNQVNALVKILIDFAVSTIAYFFIGYSIAYGLNFFSSAEVLAQKSGFDVLRVKNRNDLTLNKIMEFAHKNIKTFNTTWQDKNLNILIPMAGAGSRFEKAGYTFPKPLIDVNGKPMIQVVINNLGFESPHIFIVQKSHREKYNLDSMLSIISNVRSKITGLLGADSNTFTVVAW